MKPTPPPDIPRKTEFQCFDNAVRKMLTVSKADLEKADAKWKWERDKKRRAAEKPH